MSNHWTKEQEEALSVRGKNLLLSAAAGSGKTAVLTERIARLVKDPKNHTDINELLVLTFTKAAASEMKSRISQALSDALKEADNADDEGRIRHLEKQISLLGSAQISTLDSYFQSIIRQYFYLLDLDPKTRIISDENEEFLLEDDVLSSVLERWYEKGNPDFLDTVDLFADRYQDRALKDMVLRIFHFASSLPFPEDWIRRLPDSYRIPENTSMDDLPWDKPVLEKLISLSEKIMDSYRQIFAIMEMNPAAEAVYSEQMSGEYAYFSTLSSMKSWKDWFRLPSFAFARLKGMSKAQAEAFHFAKSADFTNSEDAETIKNLRESAKKLWQKEIAPFAQIPEKQWIEETAAMLPTVTVLSRLALDFSAALKSRKKQEGLMDFNDMEHYALDILLDRDNPAFTPEKASSFPSAAALSIRSRFKEVMIDEYQDTNGVQELITTLVSTGNNRFMVGDIKQSIYRFRQADPTIFLEKYHEYSLEKDAPSHRIDLNRNFRSDAAILSSINFIFRQMMTRKTLELDYGDAEALYAGRHEEKRPPAYVGGSVSMDLIDRKDMEEADVSDDVKDMENMALEGRLIARRIHEMMDGGMVMEKDGTFRPMKYGDIVILLRSIAGKGPQLMKVLEENHIPAVSDKEEDFMENGEVEILWALLKILDNPRQDLALAAVLRSYFVGLDEKDLTLLYLEKGDLCETDLWSVLPSTVLSEEKEKKLRRFLTLYRDWRKNAMRDGTAPLLRRILGDTDYLTYVSGLSGGAWRAGHILSFYHLALERDSAPKSGLYSFLNYLSQLKKEKKSFKAQTVSSIPDSVHIMTIHKSKGLEFPVVFLADTQKEFNLRDTWQTAICHKDLGLGIQYYDKKNKVRWPSLYWYALREASRRENMAEEARLLYVAMTRARDKLFITAIKKDAAAELDRWTTSLASAGKGEELSPLPAHLIANAKSFLDWIMPAALHHRTMKEAWDRAGKIPSYRNDAPSDHSLFTFSITSQTDLLTEEEKEALDRKGTEEILPSPKEENRKEKTELSHFLTHLPCKAPGWMDAQLSWTYGHRGALETPAKLTATAAVHLRELAEYKESEEPPLPSVILAQDGDDALDADYAAPPLFLSGDETKYQGTSFGTLMHRAMEMIDFTTLPAEETAIESALHGLVEKKVFTEEEGHILLSGKRKPTPVSSLLTFARSPLAEKMKTASAIRKEMPFSILLPARSFYPDCEEGENIFLQGVMDCLLEYEKDFIIIDYKTDRTMTEEELKNHYKIQLQVYGEAAEKLLRKPVSHLYLWSFTYGKAIEVEKM